MSSKLYKTFAIAGAGNIGSALLKQFSVQGVSVTVLTRVDGSSLSAELSSLPHVVVKDVDYSVHSSLVDGLRGIDVVISTLGMGGSPAQNALADAAKEAGARLFVPSEWAAPTIGYKESESVGYPDKIKVHEHLKAIDLPYALFFTGGWSDWSAFFIGLAQSGFTSATVVGTGDGVSSFTATADVARFVVFALTTLPPEKVEGKDFRIEGDRKSSNELIALFSRKLGKPIPVTHRDFASTKAAALRDKNLFDYLFCIFEEGKFSVRWDEIHQRADVPTSNSLYPEWHPKSVEEVIQGLSI